MKKLFLIFYILISSKLDASPFYIEEILFKENAKVIQTKLSIKHNSAYTYKKKHIKYIAVFWDVSKGDFDSAFRRMVVTHEICHHKLGHIDLDDDFEPNSLRFEYDADCCAAEIMAKNNDLPTLSFAVRYFTKKFEQTKKPRYLARADRYLQCRVN